MKLCVVSDVCCLHRVAKQFLCANVSNCQPMTNGREYDPCWPTSRFYHPSVRHHAMNENCRRRRRRVVHGMQRCAPVTFAMKIALNTTDIYRTVLLISMLNTASPRHCASTNMTGDARYPFSVVENARFKRMYKLV